MLKCYERKILLADAGAKQRNRVSIAWTGGPCSRPCNASSGGSGGVSSSSSPALRSTVRRRSRTSPRVRPVHAPAHAAVNHATVVGSPETRRRDPFTGIARRGRPSTPPLIKKEKRNPLRSDSVSRGASEDDTNHMQRSAPFRSVPRRNIPVHMQRASPACSAAAVTAGPRLGAADPASGVRPAQAESRARQVASRAGAPAPPPLPAALVVAHALRRPKAARRMRALCGGAGGPCPQNGG